MDRHGSEAQVFDPATASALADVLASCEKACCVCVPTVARELHRRGRPVRLLDADPGCGELPGFVQWDLNQPTRLADEFDIVLCDPPYYGAVLSDVLQAIRLLCHDDFDRRIMIFYLVRREGSLLRVFREFGLRPTGYRAAFEPDTVGGVREVECYANWDMPLAQW